MKKITYIFSGGRSNRLDDINSAKEFYYSYHFFKKNGNKLNIIEPHVRRNYFYKLLDKIINKYFDIPMYLNSFLSIRNLRTLLQSQLIIFVNESTAFSFLPYLIYQRIFKKQQTLVFIMGLFSKRINYPFFLKIHKLLINLLIKSVDNLVFLGKGEFTFATQNYKSSNKFNFLPFSVDTNFWKNTNTYSSNNEEILFIGNDGNRNTQILSRIPSKLPQYQFKYLTSIKELTSVNERNLEILKGKWSENTYSDTEIKDFYQNAKLVILPLKNTYQPSGQSVALQAMSLGIPVVISQTKGFWDPDIFNHNENIIFIEENSETAWVNSIQAIYNNDELLQKLSKNAFNTITKHYNLDVFHDKLLKILS